MNTVAILGTGRVASALARKLSSTGLEVIIGSRSSTAPEWLDETMRLTSISGAARAADLVVNATPGESSLERLSLLTEELTNTILVDVSNAVERGVDGLPGTLTYPNSSLAERLQEALPAAKVVKTLNTMLFSVMTAPDSLRSAPTVFLSGDDAAAKSHVAELLGRLGWLDEQILDLGDVRTARGPEAMILFVPDLIRVRGFAPFALTVVS